MAEASGLGKDAANDLVEAVKNLAQTSANPTVDVNTDEANQKIHDTKLRLQSMPNGQFMVYGNNDQAMQALAEVTGATIDPKTGTLTLNKDQYDIALAIANGAKIDPKTGYLLGDNSDMWKKVAAANGWRIDPKTGFIYGNNGHAMRSVRQVQEQKISDKNFSINALGADYAAQQIGRLQQMQIGDKSFTVTTYYTSQGEKVHGGTIPKGNALGGYISGPGTGTSDSILRRVSNGEYITNARSTAKYRRELEAINGGYYEQLRAAGGYASGGYVQATPAAPYVEAARNEGRPVFNQYLTQQMYSTGSPQVQADLAAARARSATRGLLNGVR